MTAPRIFDFTALAAHRERARRLAGDTFLRREAEESLQARLAATNRRFEKVLALDAFDERETVQAQDRSLDLVTSVLALHTVNDLPGVLHQIRAKLKPDGLFLGALFGGDTLRELREAFAAAEIETTGGVSPARGALRRRARPWRPAAARGLRAARRRCRAHDRELSRFLFPCREICARMARPMRWCSAAADFFAAGLWLRCSRVMRRLLPLSTSSTSPAGRRTRASRNR